ncbi:hypothetical protein, partial [Streptomyces griseorubiginosus]|uniref:hypothetical protein n=1 Tax=Streptomyces griseorubiginosus TaxID=67304 RepID=UPI003435EA94
MISTIRSLAWGSGGRPPMLADGNGSPGLGDGPHDRRRGCGGFEIELSRRERMDHMTVRVEARPDTPDDEREAAA